MDTVDLFYKRIQDILANYRNVVINKNFVDKTGPIELVPINMAKGELEAVDKLSAQIARLYKEYRAELNVSE